MKNDIQEDMRLAPTMQQLIDETISEKQDFFDYSLGGYSRQER
jgi:hypothetical protein